MISQASDQKIKIVPKFKSDYVGPRKPIEKAEKPKNTEVEKEDGGDSPKISTFGNGAARQMDVDNIQKMLEEKGLTTKENIKKILNFVDKI